MKVALQLGLTPGKTEKDKAKWAKDNGVQGIELSAFGANVEGMYRQADEITPILPVCSVCGNATLDGQRGFDFLNPDLAKRRASIDGSKAILKFCGDVGATGQIVPPIFGPPVVPNLQPWKTPLQIEDELMVAACNELGPIAAKYKTLFMLEPLNRYEQHYLSQQEDGVRIIRKTETKARKGIGLLSDFFHMHIEEFSTPKTFAAIGKYTSHIHLADNTRKEPGTGDIDFVPAFRALKKVGFKGYMAYECGITGKTKKEIEKNLKKSLTYIRNCIKKA